MTIALENKQQALAFRDELAEKIDDLLDTAKDESFFALSAARAAVVKDINKRVAQLPAVLIYVPSDTIPALVAAHNIYYDGSKEQQVIDRNNPNHPGFMAGGRDIEYLK